MTKNFLPKEFKDELIFVPLGGAGEIGMNLNLYHYRDKWIILDMGLGFADSDLPGVQITVPSINFILKKIVKDVVGIVITHAHEDHIGGIPYLWPELDCPLYATKFTSCLINEKLKEYGLLKEKKVTIVEPNSVIKISDFKLELMPITHSIPEMHALLVTTDKGKVFHTGDWRFDDDPVIGNTTNIDELKKIGESDILALVGDSTNIYNPTKSKSEGELGKNLLKIIKAHGNDQIIVTTFASNVARLQSLFSAAKKTGRKVVLVGRSLWRIYNAALESGYLVDAKAHEETAIKKFKSSELLVISTGCQGEENAALNKIASNKNQYIKTKKNDLVIFSSKIIPGNEKKIYKLFNKLVETGVKVLSEYNEFVHVSGHPSREEVEEMYDYISPKIAIPVHGESFHLSEHCNVAKDRGVKRVMQVKNGDVLLLDKDNPRKLAEVEYGKYAIDGSVLLDAGNVLLKERVMMQNNGVVFVIIMKDKNKPMKIEISAPGLLEMKGDKDLLDELHALIRDMLAQSANSSFSDMRQKVTRCVKKKISQELRKHPFVEVKILNT